MAENEKHDELLERIASLESSLRKVQNSALQQTRLRRRKYFFGVLLLFLAGSAWLFGDSFSLPHVFQDKTLLSAGDLNKNFDAVRDRLNQHERFLVPIGGMIPWHPNIVTPALTLPEGWVLCDGQVINDSDSPLDGKTAPNLNGQVSGRHAAGYFLRGSTSSGGFLTDTFQEHRHYRNFEKLAEHNMSPAGQGGNINGFATFDNNGAHHPPNQDLTGNAFDGNRSTETAPAAFRVVYIMRIR